MHINYLQYILHEFNSYVDFKKDFKSCYLFMSMMKLKKIENNIYKVWA